MLLVYFYSFSALFRNLQHERGDSFRLTCSMLFVHKIIFMHTIFWFYGERALMKWKHAQKVLSLWCTKRWWCSVRFSVCVCRRRVHSAQPPSTGSLFKIHIYFIACDLFKLRFNYPPFVCACSMRFALENENYQFWMSHNQLVRCMRMHLTGGNLAIRPHITNFPLIFDLSLSLSVWMSVFAGFSTIFGNWKWTLKWPSE